MKAKIAITVVIEAATDGQIGSAGASYLEVPADELLQACGIIESPILDGRIIARACAKNLMQRAYSRG